MIEVIDLATKPLSLTRGDSAVYKVSAVYQNNDVTPRPFVAGDIVYFTLKQSTIDTEPLIQKQITEFDEGCAAVVLSHDDTKTLPYGRLIYDVQLNTAEGMVQTIIKPSLFEVTSEVTDD